MTCNKVFQWLAAGEWFSPGAPVSSTNKTDLQDITEILSKVAFNTIPLTHMYTSQSHPKCDLYIIYVNSDFDKNSIAMLEQVIGGE